MRWASISQITGIVSALLLLACTPIQAPAGKPGEDCALDQPCAMGLSCQDSICVSTVVDAGRTDAVAVDVTGQDNPIADTMGNDLTMSDHVSSDVVFGESGIVDAGSLDRSASDSTVFGDSGISADVTGATDAALGVDVLSPADAGPALDARSPADGFSLPDVSLFRDHRRFLDASLADLSLGIDVWRPDIGGFDLWFVLDGHFPPDVDLGFDAAVGGYVGLAEDGVICGGGSVCQTTSDSCCIGLDQSLSCKSGGQCGVLSIELACDGDEDCNNNQECCFNGRGTGCVQNNTCYDNPQGVLICVRDQDCRGGFVCCASPELNRRGLDIGWCQSSCQ